MKKILAETAGRTIPYSIQAADDLFQKGYKYFQIRGLTIDRHLEYTEPFYILLIPIKELPELQSEKDVYEETNSDIFSKWLKGDNEHPQILISDIGIK